MTNRHSLKKQTKRHSKATNILTMFKAKCKIKYIVNIHKLTNMYKNTI